MTDTLIDIVFLLGVILVVCFIVHLIRISKEREAMRQRVQNESKRSYARESIPKPNRRQDYSAYAKEYRVLKAISDMHYPEDPDKNDTTRRLRLLLQQYDKQCSGYKVSPCRYIIGQCCEKINSSGLDSAQLRPYKTARSAAYQILDGKTANQVNLHLTYYKVHDE